MIYNVLEEVLTALAGTKFVTRQHTLQFRSDLLFSGVAGLIPSNRVYAR
jgi:hypothetical protein